MPDSTVTVVGNLTRDPEIRRLDDDTALCKMRIANNDRTTNIAGEWINRPQFFNVTIWAGVGEWVAANLAKGDKIVLRDQIVVTSGQGYSARLREAAVDMKQGNVVSDLPVEVTLPNGLLLSNGMEIAESGAVIRFNRGVVLTLDPAKTSEAAK